MDIKEIKTIVEEQFQLQIDAIEKVKNVYKISTLEDEFCLKVIKYEFPHFLFIISAIKHLQQREFEKIPQIIKTKDGIDYIKLIDNYAYLTPWINARLSNYDNPIDVKVAASKLAELHEASKGFKITKNMKPRIGWFKWIETYKTRRDEILDFKKRIGKKDKLSKFDEVYLSIMEEELKRAEKSITDLLKSEYMEEMKSQIKNRGFCHHDFANHNILIDSKNDVNIIDFDYCILDTPLHDLSSLLIRRMKYGKWDDKNAEEILDTYSSIKQIKKNSIEIMKAFMEFPQDYWQRGIQYYWEKKAWGEEFFLKKLEKYIEDREQKQEFLNEFRWGD